MLQLVRVVCDHAKDAQYNDHTRKALLEGLFDLADCCIADLKEQQFGDSERRPYTELELIKDFAESALRGEGSEQVFYRIGDCVYRITPLPDEPT